MRKEMTTYFLILKKTVAWKVLIKSERHVSQLREFELETVSCIV
jgi:hypothetical protein